MRRWWPLLLLLLVAALVTWWLLALPPGPADAPLDRGALPTVPEEDEAVRLEGMAEVESTPASKKTMEPSPVEPPAWHLVGRVCGAGRHPAVGVPVELRSEGVLLASTTAGEDGRFRLPPGTLPEDRWVSFVVWAKDAEGRSDLRNRGTFATRTMDLNVGTLVLRRGHTLEVIVDGEAGPVPGAHVDLFGGGQVRQGLALSATTDGEGRALMAGVPAEEFHLVAWAEGYASKARPVGMPRVVEDPIRIRLERPRTLTVEVVELPDETPVEGVVVRIFDQRGNARHTYSQALHPQPDIAPTDENGRTQIDNLGREPSYHLGVEARGYATLSWVAGMRTWRPSIRKTIPIPTDEDTMRVVLPPTRRVRWPVVAGELPVPRDGTVVTFRLPRSPATMATPGIEGGRIEGHHLVVEGLIDKPFAGVAMTPEGSLARLRIGATETEGPPISFTRPRTLTVVARHEDGAAAEGLSVSIRDAGDRSLGPYRKTDAEGVARLEGLLPESGGVRVSPPTIPVGRADLTEGDVQMEVTVPRKEDRSIPVRVTIRVDGDAALPDAYRLRTGWDESRLEVLEEDPVAGVLSCRWHPGPGKDEGTVRLTSPDHVADTRHVDLETEALTFDLVSGGSMLLQVFHEGDFRVRSTLQHWDGATRDWVAAEWVHDAWRTLEPPLRGDAWFIRRLAPGRYRVTSSPSGAVSEPVQVVAGGDLVVLTLDARLPGEIEGLVVGPQGADLSGAYVEVRRVRGDDPPREFALDEEHRFTIPWTYGTDAIKLTARHPLLRPHPEKGSIRLRGAQDFVRLELSYGPVASVLLDVEAEGDAAPAPPKQTRLLLLRSATDRTPVRRVPAAVEVEGDRRWRLSFTGYEPGTWTIWSDVGGSRYAPLVLLDVDLDELDPDLGTVRLVRGSTVRLDLKATGEMAPSFGVLHVESLEGPAYARQEMRVGSGVLSVSGLGPGRYRVTGGWMGVEDDQTPTDLDEEIEIDGRSTYERKLER